VRIVLQFRQLQLSPSGSNSVVECQLPKLDVAGSIPVSRSKILPVKVPFTRII
jgi:hypothetical protein